MADEFQMWMGFMEKAQILTANKKRRQNGWRLQTTQTIEDLENEAIRAWESWLAVRRQASKPTQEVPPDLEDIDMKALQEFLKQHQAPKNGVSGRQRVMKSGA